MKRKKLYSLLITLSLLNACNTNINDTENIIQSSNPNTINSVLPQPSVTNISNPDTIPAIENTPSPSQTLQYKNLVKVEGKIYDINGKIVENAVVSAKPVNSNLSWTGETQKIIDGSYSFKNVPANIQIQITATKENWTIRERTEILKPELVNDKTVNIFNFGDPSGEKSENNIYALQDEPEIISLKVNGKQVLSSVASDKLINDKGGIPSVSKYTFSELKNSKVYLDEAFLDSKYQPSLTNIDNDKLEIEMTFSEPVIHTEVENYFKIQSQYFENNKNLVLNKDLEGASFSWSADNKTCIFKYNKPLISNIDGNEARYMIQFTYPFQDKNYNFALQNKYFRFSNAQTNDFAIFSVKNNQINKPDDIYNYIPFSGKVYDLNGKPVEGALVVATAIDLNTLWPTQSQKTIADGSYKFSKVRISSRLKITATKEGWTTRDRFETLRSSMSDPSANVYNFGSTYGNGLSGDNIYAIQDEPEISLLRINGRQVLSSFSGDSFNGTTGMPAPTSLGTDQNGLASKSFAPSLTKVDNNFLEIEIKFSEPVIKSDIENYFRISSQTFEDGTNFIIDKNSDGASFTWSDNDRYCIFKYNKPIRNNKQGNEARYILNLLSPFHDLTNKLAVETRYFRFSTSQINNFATFSVKNSD